MSLAFLTLAMVFSAIDYTSADAIHLQIVNNASCYQVLDKLDAFDYYQLNWDGCVLSPYCKLGFKRVPSDTREKYKVCVNTLKYHITDCHFKLKYYSHSILDTIQEYSCRTFKPPKFCAAEGDTLWIGFSTAVPSNSTFQLIVKAVNTNTPQKKVNKNGLYSMVGGISLMLVLLACMIILAVRKKYKQFQHSRTPFNASMGQGALFRSCTYNQGYTNIEEDDLDPHNVTIRPPEYSEKADKRSPPPYTALNS